MNKMFAVFKREYIQAVRKKMFIIMTFLMPVLMSALMVIPSMLMMRSMGGKKVAVLDGTGQLKSAFTAVEVDEDVQKKAQAVSGNRNADVAKLMNIDYVDGAAEPNLDAAAKPYLDRVTRGEKGAKLDGVLVIPKDAVAAEEVQLKYYSRSSTDFIAQERLSSVTNRALQRIRLEQRGIAQADLEKIMKRAQVDSVQLSKSGERKSGGSGNFIIGFVFTALLILPSFIYGLEIMRGIIQEKTDRVVEVLVSSMSAEQLLIGKILGVAAVGLTQISVWLIMASLAATFGATTAAMAGINVLQFLRPLTFVYFVVFFILAYLTYVCVYAIGGAVCNSEKEAQQMIAPITMLMMLPWFLLVGIITNPDSSLSVGFSLAPVFGPVTMFVRTLVSEPPMWHVLLTVVVSIATVAAMFWATAKIFRVGILSYGKRPTIPELLRWIRLA